MLTGDKGVTARHLATSCGMIDNKSFHIQNSKHDQTVIYAIADTMDKSKLKANLMVCLNKWNKANNQL